MRDNWSIGTYFVAANLFAVCTIELYELKPMRLLNHANKPNRAAGTEPNSIGIKLRKRIRSKVSEFIQTRPTRNKL